MADCVVQKAACMNVKPRVTQRLKDLLKLGFGQQAIRHPPLVPEFVEFQHLLEPSNDPAFKLLAAPIQWGQSNPEQPDEDQSQQEQLHNVWTCLPTTLGSLYSQQTVFAS